MRLGCCSDGPCKSSRSHCPSFQLQDKSRPIITHSLAGLIVSGCPLSDRIDPADPVCSKHDPCPTCRPNAVRPPHTYLIPSLRKCNQTKKVGLLFFRTYIWKFKRGSWLFHTPASEITDRQRAVNPAAGRLDKTPKSSPVPRVPSIIHNVIHEQSSQRTHARPRAVGIRSSPQPPDLRSQGQHMNSSLLEEPGRGWIQFKPGYLNPQRLKGAYCFLEAFNKPINPP